MKVSVLMPIYKKSNPIYLDISINSILKQTRKPDEFVIIVDGPLGPEAEAILEKYKKKITVYRYKINLGSGYALKYGVNQCKYEYIARHDADDIALPDRLEKQVKYMEEHPDVDILGGQIMEIFDNKNYVFGKREVPLTDKDIKKYMKTRCPFNHQTVMFKKSSILAVGNYPLYKYIQDYALWVEAYNLNMANLNDYLTKVRVDNNNYRKRGTRKYVREIKRLEHRMRDLNIISTFQMRLNIFIRSFVIDLPNGLRRGIYKRILREKVDEEDIKNL